MFYITLHLLSTKNTAVEFIIVLKWLCDNNSSNNNYLNAAQKLKCAYNLL